MFPLISYYNMYQYLTNLGFDNTNNQPISTLADDSPIKAIPKDVVLEIFSSISMSQEQV